MLLKLTPKKLDSVIVGLALALSLSGLVLIRSLSVGQENFFWKQFVFLLLAAGAMLVVQSFDRYFWRNASIIFYFVLLILLGLLLIFAAPIRGTRGWFDLGALSFQPAEFAKIAVVLFLATTLERLNFDIANWRHLLLTAAIVGLPAGLIFLQPDFGSAFVIVVTGAAMILFTGLEKRQLAVIFSAALLLLLFGWFGVLRDYQKQRVLTFFNPQSDPLGSGYNVNQSIVAIGSGGLWGRGLGQGTQSQLKFLPESKTDFIFASLAEELGFIGAAVLLLLYILLLWRIYVFMRQGNDLFSSFLLLGLFTIFLSQIIINIAMNMGLFPVTGLTLPLVSYGGSSLVASYLMLGLIQSVRGSRKTIESKL